MVAAKKPLPRGERVRKDADEVNAELEKKFGRNIIIDASTLKGVKLKRATSGSLSLDMMLGGGWPLNQWNEIIGKASSGKTSSIYETVAAQMAINPKYKVLWVASEPFASQWAETAGINLANVKLAETAFMEEAYETVIEYLDNRLVDCIVIDSFPALVPMGEEEAAMGDWQMALGAKVTNKFFRKASPAQKRDLTGTADRDCLLFIVNQWRSKVGLVFGDPRTTPGGEGKDYFYYTRVEFARDEWIVPDKQTKRRVGISMRAHTIKNKTAPVERTANVDFYFEDDVVPAGTYDIGLDLYNGAEFTEVIERVGNRYVFGDLVWTKKVDVIQSLREDIDLQASVRYEVLKAYGVDVEPPSKTKAKRVPRKPAPGSAQELLDTIDAGLASIHSPGSTRGKKMWGK